MAGGAQDENLLVQSADDNTGPQNLLVSTVDLRGGWSTRTLPHLLEYNQLAVADNVVYYRDGLVSKRPGNVLYGGGTGHTGGGGSILSLARFYFGSPRTGTLIAQSGGRMYSGNDGTGAFTAISPVAAVSATTPVATAQLYDPDNANTTTLFVADGTHVPQMWNGTTWASVSTAAGFLPTNPRNAGNPITPRFCVAWGMHLVYAGDPNDPGAVWISDAERPERFSGYALLDSAGTSYYAYHPGGADSPLGSVTGLAVLNDYLLVFYTNGIVRVLNTGTYGAFQYLFKTISPTIGATAPQSIVAFPNYIAFFGGDKFYATDGETLAVLPDEIPTVYANNAQSVNPPEIKNRATVSSVRRGRQYWASYDSTGSGTLDKLVVFDNTANGGWAYGAREGGAWARWPSGMKLQAAVECNGPGDSGQLFWGDSTADLVYQHDVGTYSDNGAAIAMEVRARSFFVSAPLFLKTIYELWLMTALDVKQTAYVASAQPYVVFDATQVEGNAINIPVSQGGAIWGTAVWGQFTWTPATNVQQSSPKTYLQGQNDQGLSFSPGMVENSKNPFSLFGFGVRATQEGTPLP